MDEALLSISPIDRGQLVKILITIEPLGIFGANFASYLFYNCPGTRERLLGEFKT